jgi:hypothetical protein
MGGDGQSPGETLQAEIRIPRLNGGKLICAPVEFRKDDGSDRTLLGSWAIHQHLKLTRGDTEKSPDVHAFDESPVKMRSVTGYLRLVHKPPVSFMHWYEVSVFKLEFLMVDRVFDQSPWDSRANPMRSLLGQDVIRYLTKIGERKGRRPSLRWALYSVRPNQVDSYWSGERTVGENFPYVPIPTTHPEMSYPAIGRRYGYFGGTPSTVLDPA